MPAFHFKAKTRNRRTYTHTRKELDHCSDPLGTESHKPKPRPNLIYIYTDRTTMATSCDLNAPRCTTEVLRVRSHGSRGGVFVGHRPPRDPGDPSYLKKEIAQKFYIYTDVTHTRTHSCSELSLRIRLWSASDVQKHQQLNDKMNIHLYI